MATTQKPPAPAPPRTLRAGELGTPQYRRFFGAGRELTIHWLTFLVTAALVLAPVVPILYQSVRNQPLYAAGGAFTLSNYVHLFTEAEFGKIILHTLYFAVLTTVFALAIAVPMAILLQRTKFPAARLIGQLLRWPIYISPLVLAFGWIVVYGPAGFLTTALREGLGWVPWNLYTLPGMAFVEAVAQIPVAYLFCANALAASDTSLENAARTVGAGPMRILRSIVVPMLRPPMLYAGLLIFGTAVETLSIPLILGEPAEITLFSSFLYEQGIDSVNPDYGLLGAASTLILLSTVGLVVLQSRLLKHAQRFVSVRGKATRSNLLDIGKWKWLGFAFVGLYIVFGALLPMIALILRAFTSLLTPLVNPLKLLTLDNFRLIFSYEPYTESIVNSITVAFIGAVVVTLFGTVVVLVARRSKFRLARLLETAAQSPHAVPGLIIGIGFFWAFAWMPGGDAIRGTILALIIAFGVRALPSAYGAISPATMQLGSELDNAARVAGADWWRTVSRILIRLLVPAMLASFLLIWTQMIREYAPAMFLAGSEAQVIGTTAIDLWTQGETGSVAALATLQIAVTAVVAGLAGFLLKGKNNA
ncbi:ABC transporter permease [Streptomyces viridochromogenes]|uniref:Putative integral membrane protein n=1 Tax=Streptomyces viridochromogenes Tue57 TaxID=1160705 RepID=L8P4R2_STRVR|nr:iron ABC transporter permease [Streptomyces viridochromogenes]ELS51144.1 putative integral membrane protein [Streptomyces viridochromogenes Tue57]